MNLVTTLIPPLDDPAQVRLRKWFLDLGSSVWIPLLTSLREEGRNFGMLAGLAPTSYRTTALNDASWDLHHGAGRPGFTQTYGGSEPVTTYLRTPSEPLERLVHEREFHGVRSDYNELSEEFRLYHDLARGSEEGELVQIDDAGNTTVAARVGEETVEVLTKLVRMFQAAKQMDLLLFVDSVVFYDPTLPRPEDQVWRTADLNAELHVGIVGGRPVTRFLATRVITAPPIERAGVWPYEADDAHYPEFIIGSDDLGNAARFTCDPDQLANYFGANAGAPHYLTPVHFRREVLGKYYVRPDLYTVEDGYLRCGALWGLRMDNDNPEKVIVYLGDLGRDLPTSERDYWRSFNVAPSGGISETAFRRGFLAQFADATAVDLRIRSAYPALRRAWQERFGWPLFRDPAPGDAHLLNIVRLPLHDTEAEFEELVRTLTKLLIDFLDEAELVRALPPGPPDEKGITRLERWLIQAGYPSVEADIRFLRDLQAVRSKGTAHAKGSEYEKTLARVFGPRRKAAASSALMDRTLTLLTALAAFAEGPPTARDAEATIDAGAKSGTGT